MIKENHKKSSSSNFEEKVHACDPEFQLCMGKRKSEVIVSIKVAVSCFICLPGPVTSLPKGKITIVGALGAKD